MTARCVGNRPGTVFLPFHYGGTDTAANELTPTSWDPVSKQPQFKAGAVRVLPSKRWLIMHLSSYLGLLETGGAPWRGPIARSPPVMPTSRT